MPRYFFCFVSGDRVITDSRGVELTGLEAAHWHAVKLAYQMRYHLPEDDFELDDRDQRHGKKNP